MTLTAVAVVCAAVLLGAGLQRIAGMGMGMVAAPVMSLVVGALAGVTMSNVAACVTAAVLMRVMWHEVDWGRFARLAPLLVAGSVAGAFVVRYVGHDVLDVLLGGSVLIAIAAALGLQQRVHATGIAVAHTAGAAAGFMNTVSGVGGPALAVYGVASRWRQAAMAATLQPIFLLSNGLSIVTKWLAGARPPADVVPWWVWPALAVSAVVGIALGGTLRPRISTRAARGATLTVATAGGAIALVRGLIGVLT